jgi:hypothetical protein
VEDTSLYLSPNKLSYVFGHVACCAARTMVWLLPEVAEVNSLGVERMVRALSVLQAPLLALAVTGARALGG